MTTTSRDGFVPKQAPTAHLMPATDEAPEQLPSRRQLLSVLDLGPEELDLLLQRSCELYRSADSHDSPLRGSILGMLFETTSTRTRTAFSAATIRLGGSVVAYGPGELQLATGESLADTGRMLSVMLDGIVVRTPRPVAALRELGAGLRIVNAMAMEEHPTQAICDLATLKMQPGGLAGLRIAYIGEGNNTACALARAVAVLGADIQLTLATPAGYGLPAETIGALSARLAGGASLRQVHDVAEIPDEIDVVYTTRWQTTGTAKPDASWRQIFRPFHVDERLMARWPGARFMHDLPAHRGDEVCASVLDGPRSIAWDQARMKLTSAMAVLEWLMR